MLFIILGILLCSIGLFFIIIYLNLFTFGYSFLEFVNFIIRIPYFYSLPLGVLSIIYGLERKKLNELLLRYRLRFSRK